MPMAIMIYPDDCVHSTTVCALMVGRACLQLAHPPQPLPHPTPSYLPTPYTRQPWYYTSRKNLSQKPKVNNAR